jgi:hypothetical protein
MNTLTMRLVVLLSLVACYAGYVLANPLPGRCGDAQGGANQSCKGCQPSGQDGVWYLYDPTVTFYVCDVTVQTPTCDNNMQDVSCNYTKWTDNGCTQHQVGGMQTYYPRTCK